MNQNNNDMKFINSCAVAGILWLLLWAACGCKTTKYVERTKTVYDSTAIFQNQVLKQTISDQKQYYEELIKDSTGVRIEYIDNECDTVTKIVSKVVINNDGKIEAEGKLKTVQISATKQAQFLSELQHKYDSAVLSNENRKVEVKTVIKKVEKSVERRVYPFWLIGLVIIGTWILCTHRYKIPYFSTIIKFLRL